MESELRPAVETALRRHPGGIVVGTTAVRLLGVVDDDIARPGLSGIDPVEIVRAGTGARAVPGVRVRRDRLDPDEWCERDGLRLATPVRTAYDLGRRLGTVDAVVLLEALGRRYDIIADDVRAVAARHPHARGLPQLRTALSHVEPDARDPFETRLRFGLVLAGLPAPTVGPVITDADGATLGVLDLGWPRERCGVLCGRDHATASRMAGGLVEHGWTVQCVSADEAEADARGAVYLAQVGHMVRWHARRWQARYGPLPPSRPRRRRATVRLYDAESGTAQKGQPSAGHPIAESTATATNRPVR